MTPRGEIKRSRRRGRLVVWAVAAMVFLSLVVVAAEVVVRRYPDLMPVHKQLAENAIHSPFIGNVADPDVGFLEKPGLNQTVNTRDYTLVEESDHAGFPNTDPWPNPAGMVFLGDSSIVGYGVSQPASFPRLAAERLHLSEVNLGLAASGPERQLAVYRKFGMALHPRHVFTCLYLVSDFENDRHFSAWIDRGKSGKYDDVRLAMARATAEARSATLGGYLEKSWIYGLVRNQIYEWIPSLRGLPERYRFPDGSELLFNKKAIEFAMAKAAPNDEAIEKLMATLEKMRKVVVQGGSSLSVVLVPSKEELFAVPPAATGANLVARARERLQKAGFLVLDLYPAVRQAGVTRSPFFRIDGHLNDYGHRIVADAFVSWFRQTFAE